MERISAEIECRSSVVNGDLSRPGMMKVSELELRWHLFWSTECEVLEEEELELEKLVELCKK